MNLDEYYKINDVKDVVGTILGTDLDTSGINKISDCVKNLDDIILDKITDAIITKILENDSAENIVGTLTSTVQLVNEGKNLIELVKGLTVPDLVTSLLALKALKGGSFEALNAIVDIRNRFGGYVDNLNDLIDNIASIDLCKVTNVRPNGQYIPPLAKTPTLPPSPIVVPEETLIVDDGSNTKKTAYDDMMFRFTSAIAKSDKLNDPSYDSAISTLMTVAYAYHDKLSRSTDDSKDDQFLKEFNTSIQNESDRASWSSDCKIMFASRAKSVSTVLSNDAQIIRDYYQRSTAISGECISTGVTVYSGPEYDFTTFLDLKESERPPELVAKWSAKYNIKEQEAKLRARGIKPQTLNYADAFNGAYGKIVSDQTVASTRLPGGSKILLRNPDGSIYNPSGKNPSGIFTVKDTGNTKLTYNKFDIFSLDPAPYLKSNMSGVKVYLISKGTQTTAKYLNAQKLYGA